MTGLELEFEEEDVERISGSGLLLPLLPEVVVVLVLIARSSSSMYFSKIPCLEICLKRACLSLPK